MDKGIVSNQTNDPRVPTSAINANDGSAEPPQQPPEATSGHPSSDENAAVESRAALAARLKASNTVELFVFEEADDSSSQAAPPLADVASLDVDVEQQSGSKQQITFKSEQGRLLLLLPSAPEKSFTPAEWEELCQQLTLRLSSENRFLEPNTTVHLIARDRLLDNRQLQEIDRLLQTAQLQLKRIYTQRRQTAVAAATAGYSVEQQTKLEHLNDSSSRGKALETPLYVQTTVRSGTEIRHPGSIVVIGDVNPGGSLIAAGDIFVWGRLRGVAHAGSDGNAACRIMALHMQPTQLRIADSVARAPEKPPSQYQPEVAYVSHEDPSSGIQGGIRIAIASEFAQIHLNAP
ncbi:septum site-determining protein MinC [Leptothoe sp. PORK10 BA2]|uniref:septum site-determining protein MinC n=1 Tax=Leptothoe sp. PORK10 BA2 TaxID=3110254 RepID=UPI002B1FF0C9|nr:septum site-determining protein MinC [Leptothoe sp. PORK10 BA2]MEA5465484.1 septum site-determining protein MinC [Leptothoe sp. PORK10 BA2]